MVVEKYLLKVWSALGPVIQIYEKFKKKLNFGNQKTKLNLGILPVE